MASRRTAFIEPFLKLPFNTFPLVHLVYIENKIGAKFIDMNAWRKIFGIKLKLRI